MGRLTLEVADIFRLYGPAYREAHANSMTSGQLRVMHAIEVCRTAELGGHIEQCDRCAHQINTYNSCANRHCPKCQSLARAKWLEKQRAQVLPISYFHVVFTVPDKIASVALQNKKVVYRILFRSVSETLRRIAADPKHLGAQIGFLAVLHTWGQNLMHHPHIHCVVSGGGISPEQSRWISCRKAFFVSVRVLSRLFRGLFLCYLNEAFEAGQLKFNGTLQELAGRQAFKALLKSCRKIEWVVYSKPPFGGPDQVLDYLGRYTHRVAISNHRLVSLKDGKVTFRWRDYRDGNKQKMMTLDAQEFIRRFLLHVLPHGFVRIRHYGFLANAHREKKLAHCRHLLQADPPNAASFSQQEDWKAFYERLTGKSLTICPACRQGHMVPVESIPALRDRHQPIAWIDSS
jgi:hypothetical protein